MTGDRRNVRVALPPGEVGIPGRYERLNMLNISKVHLGSFDFRASSLKASSLKASSLRSKILRMLGWLRLTERSFEDTLTLIG
jgi:hypothetical protein